LLAPALRASAAETIPFRTVSRQPAKCRCERLRIAWGHHQAGVSILHDKSDA